MGCDVVVAGGDAAAEVAVRRVFAAHERTFSRFLPGSELRSVNAAAGRPTLLSPAFAEMLERALRMSERSGGLLDPTVGASLDALGYDVDFTLLADDPRPPAPVGPAPGWGRVHLAGRLLSMPAGCVLDLNGVVKASAVDAAAGLLPGPGYVSAGGDLAVRGEADVALPGGGAVRIVRGGMATSGTSRRRWRRGGRVCHHLIDPRTGLPAESPWREVTASGATCLDADAAARIGLLAAADGPAWLDERAIAGRFVAADGAVTVNATWAAMTAEPACI
jgi:thiamine biosynthesis lipoprotein